LGNLEEGSSTGDFERRMKGALVMGLLSLKRLHGGGLGGGASSLETLEDMFRLSLDMGLSLYRGPYSTAGNLASGGGGSYTGDFVRWMKEGSFTGEL